MEFVDGYEAGCMGCTLYRQLEAAGITCKILALSTIPVANNARKTDRRDSKNIATSCLAYNNAQFIYIPSEDDEAVNDCLRMKDDIKSDLTKVNQRMNHFCIRHGKMFDGKSH